MPTIAIRGLRYLPVVIALGTFGITGCSQEGALKGAIPTFPATGAVTMDGKPFGPAKLSMQQVDDKDNKKPTVSLVVDSSGKITSVTTYKPNDGAPAGSYKIYLSNDPMTPAPPHPAIYNDKDKSDLTASIKDSGANEIKVDLKSSAGPMTEGGGGVPGIQNAPGGGGPGPGYGDVIPKNPGKK